MRKKEGRQAHPNKTKETELHCRSLKQFVPKYQLQRTGYSSFFKAGSERNNQGGPKPCKRGVAYRAKPHPLASHGTAVM
jgi:hypothetical protein